LGERDQCPACTRPDRVTLRIILRTMKYDSRDVERNMAIRENDAGLHRMY
jgi:hypothetical protein